MRPARFVAPFALVLAVLAPRAGADPVVITSLPITIEHCGLYVLDDCLRAAEQTDAITVAANDVTIDLRGFTLIAGTATLSAIRVAGPFQDVTIRNGAIRGFGDHGVDGTFALGLRVQSLQVTDCNKNGIRAGQGAIVEDCIVRGSGDAQITVSSGVVRRCTATDGGNDGIFVGRGTVEACVVTGNDLHGVVTGDGVTVSDVVADENGNDGIDVGGHSVVRGCTARRNLGNGIQADDGSLVVDCTAVDNQTNGIQVGDGATVRGCVARSNFGDGIRGSGTRARVEENALTGNQTGLRFLGSNNVAFRNTFSGNVTDSAFPAGNTFGPFVAGGGSLAGVDPWANVVH